MSADRSSIQSTPLSPSTLQLPQTDLESGGPELAGVGPFTITEFTPNTELAFAKRADYQWAPESIADGQKAAYQLTKTRAALSDVLWNRLREIQMDCWTSRSESLAFAMAEVFGPALKRGARIVRRGEGLGTLVRRT